MPVAVADVAVVPCCGGEPSPDDPPSEVRGRAGMSADDGELKKWLDDEEAEVSISPMGVKPSGMKSSVKPKGPKSKPASRSRSLSSSSFG